MKAIPRNLTSMLIAGALAGFLSGLMLPLVFGLRGALFGVCLSLTAWLIQQDEWKQYTFIPGLLLGIGLGFFPVKILEELGSEAPPYDFFALVNCTIFIPVYCLANLYPKFRSRLWRMAIAGLISSVLRMLSIELHWSAFPFSLYVFLIGTLPFILLWLGAMQLTDRRFGQVKNDRP